MEGIPKFLNSIRIIITNAHLTGDAANAMRYSHYIEIYNAESRASITDARIGVGYLAKDPHVCACG